MTVSYNQKVWKYSAAASTPSVDQRKQEGGTHHRHGEANLTSEPAVNHRLGQPRGMVRRKMQEFIQSLLKEEVTELLGRRKSERRKVVDSLPAYRNGHGKTRQLTLGCGTVIVRRPRVRGLEGRFESRVLPLFTRRSEGVSKPIPQLYLQGLALRDFNLALRGLPVIPGLRLARTPATSGGQRSRNLLVCPFLFHQQRSGVFRNNLFPPRNGFLRMASAATFFASSVGAWRRARSSASNSVLLILPPRYLSGDNAEGIGCPIFSHEGHAVILR